VLIVTWLHWASAARIAAELFGAELDVDVVCTDWHPILSIKGISKRHRYGGADAQSSLAQAIHRSAPQLIVAGDDIAISHLQSLRKTGSAELTALIDDSLGPAGSYEIILSRARFMAAAKSAGVDTPAGAEVRTAAELNDWLAEFGTPAFVKSDGSAGGEGVRLLRDAKDQAAAVESLRRAPIYDAVDRHGAAPAVSVQKAIVGQPANCSALAWRGEVLGVISVATLQTLRPFGIATVVRPLENAAMRSAAVAIARELNLSGFFGLDFILQDGGRRAWVLELNPRPTPISHFALGPGRDLIAALISKLQDHPTPDRPVTFPLNSAVAIFPHLLRRGSVTGQNHDDLPLAQPQLVAAFERRRRFTEWRARIVNLFRPDPPAQLAVELGQPSGVPGG
jgi:hypothetical protein